MARERFADRIAAAVALVLAAMVGVVGTVLACTDSSPTPTWSLAAPAFEDVSRPMLAPGNDTRVNIVWLMRTIHPVGDGAADYVKPDYDSAELGHSFLTWAVLRASLWPHADAATAATPTPDCAPPAAVSGFDAAVTSDTGVPAADRNKLIALRAKVGCGPTDLTAPMISTNARMYLAYLAASAAFHAGDWQAARDGFASLVTAHNPWLAETAAYMPIRIALRQALVGAVDKYGDFAGADKANGVQVAAARAAIAAYLQRWPTGRYAASARALMRRVLWLSGDTAGLAHAYERLLQAIPADSEAAPDLAEEIDLKLLATEGVGRTLRQAGDTRLLLAVDDLRQMRRPVDSAASVKPLNLTATDLAAQAPAFSTKAELFAFLQATRSFYAGEPATSISAAIPQDLRAPGATPLAYSRQMLRGMALAKADDAGEVRFWTALIPGVRPLYQLPFAELGLALRWQRDDRFDLIFAAGSPVEDRMTREILLQTVVPPAILRGDAANTTRSVHERDVARFTLLYKDLSRQAYADFGHDVTLVPISALGGALSAFSGDQPVAIGLFTHGDWSDGFSCPALVKTAATLARDRDDHRALLCLGDFWRLNGFDQFSPLPARDGSDTLGHRPDRFGGKRLSRDAIYTTIIADQRASPDERAYALYRAVMCYAPSGYNGCSGPFVSAAEMNAATVAKTIRQGWFLELKRRYPDSRWAQALNYYW